MNYNLWYCIKPLLVSIASQRNLLIENSKTDSPSTKLYTQDKDVHDTFQGYFYDSKSNLSPKRKRCSHQLLINPIYSALCEIKIEPFKVTDHHQKNFYKNQLKNPSEFK